MASVQPAAEVATQPPRKLAHVVGESRPKVLEIALSRDTAAASCSGVALPDPAADGRALDRVDDPAETRAEQDLLQPRIDHAVVARSHGRGPNALTHADETEQFVEKRARVRYEIVVEQHFHALRRKVFADHVEMAAVQTAVDENRKPPAGLPEAHALVALLAQRVSGYRAVDRVAKDREHAHTRQIACDVRQRLAAVHVVRADLAAGDGVARGDELGCIPFETTRIVRVKKMQLLLLAHVHVGVLRETVVRPGRTGALRADPDEGRQHRFPGSRHAMKSAVAAAAQSRHTCREKVWLASGSLRVTTRGGPRAFRHSSERSSSSSNSVATMSLPLRRTRMRPLKALAPASIRRRKCSSSSLIACRARRRFERKPPAAFRTAEGSVAIRLQNPGLRSLRP